MKIHIAPYLFIRYCDQVLVVAKKLMLHYIWGNTNAYSASSLL